MRQYSETTDVGFIPVNVSGEARYTTRFGQTNQILSPFGLGSNFDLTSPDNELFKLNSVRGGVIIPRGTSIVGKDLRKTKIRPKYVPDPENVISNQVHIQIDRCLLYFTVYYI